VLCVVTFLKLTHVTSTFESVTSASASAGQELETHEKRRGNLQGACTCVRFLDLMALIENTVAFLGVSLFNPVDIY
jgi:hypothetical protein